MRIAGILLAVACTASLVSGVAQAAGPVAGQKARSGASPVLPGGNTKAPITVDASKLEYFDKDQKLVYSGGVVATQGESTMRAKVMVVFLARPDEQASLQSDTGRIRRIEAAGPVTVTQVDQVGTGDSGLYDKAENKVYLIGNVVLSQGPNVTKGERDSKLVYDLDTGYAQVIGGRVNSIFTPGSADEKKTPEKKSSAAQSGAKPVR
jgi:lipopolysaccharide export system protein LptA